MPQSFGARPTAEPRINNSQEFAGLAQAAERQGPKVRSHQDGFAMCSRQGSRRTAVPTAGSRTFVASRSPTSSVWRRPAADTSSCVCSKKYDSFRGPEVIVSPMLKTRAFLNWGELLNLALERFGNFKFNAQTRKTKLFNAERPNAPKNSFTLATQWVGQSASRAGPLPVRLP